jgi:hypothetical protein
MYNDTITEPYSLKPFITYRSYTYTGVPLVFFTLWVDTDFAVDLYYGNLLAYIALEKSFRERERLILKKEKKTYIYSKCAHWSNYRSAPLVR